jgi:hypothetical protein
MSNRFSYVKFASNYNQNTIGSFATGTKSMLDSIYTSDVDIRLFKRLNKSPKFKHYMESEGSVVITSNSLLTFKGYDNVVVFDEKHPLYNLDLFYLFDRRLKSINISDIIRKLLVDYMSTVNHNIIKYDELFSQ